MAHGGFDPSVSEIFWSQDSPMDAAVAHGARPRRRLLRPPQRPHAFPDALAGPKTPALLQNVLSNMSNLPNMINTSFSGLPAKARQGSFSEQGGPDGGASSMGAWSTAVVWGFSFRVAREA